MAAQLGTYPNPDPEDSWEEIKLGDLRNIYRSLNDADKSDIANRLWGTTVPPREIGPPP